jgi:hypothetical protein
MSDECFGFTAGFASAAAGSCIFDLAPNHPFAAFAGGLAVAATLFAFREIADSVTKSAKPIDPVSDGRLGMALPGTPKV